MVGGNGLTKTRLPKMDEQVVVYVLGSDYVSTALLFHAVK